MSTQGEGTYGARREVPSGVLLIAASLALIAVMTHHPTAHSLLSEEGFARQARQNVMVHALAVAVIPVLFLGLLGLWRRLGRSDLATSALVVFGLGCVAVMSSAVVSGFVATSVARNLLAAEAGARDVYRALITLTGQVNHGYTAVYVVASSVAILLWSAAILRSRRMPRASGAAGVAGFVIGAGIALAFLSGHLGLGLHGFGIIAFAQSAWLIWVGILLCVETSPRGAAPGGPAKDGPAPNGPT